MTLRAAIFDLDYTLVDSTAAVIQCARAGFEAAGLKPPEDEIVARSIGASFQEVAAQYAGDLAEQVIAGFRAESHRLTWLAITSLMPEALATLGILREKGLSLGLATSKSKVGMEAILQYHSLEKFFQAAISGDCVPARKPQPDALLACARELGVSPEAALYVGDHPYDILAAQAAGIRAASIATGPTQAEELAALKPDWLLLSLAELPALIESL
jgi:HAD superfamily hydrolase (TIGR01509 family)